MARKKEPGLQEKNRNHIIQTAKRLFEEHGVEGTGMDEVARAASMSKSTIYVYFKSKEEIFYCIALEAISVLRDGIAKALQNQESSLKETYDYICQALVNMKETYPLYFHIIVENIEVSEEAMEQQPVLRQLYDTGEEINELLGTYFAALQMGNDKAATARNVFIQWGSIYGIIILADNKEAYIKKAMGDTKETFLKQAFEKLYQLLGGEHE